jgi:hypothetical protein
MKRVLFLTMALLVVCCASIAQDAKEFMKERQATSKLAKAELNTKVEKAAKKEAKRLAKEGWVVALGVLPLEKQLERSYVMQSEYNENGSPKYIIANGRSVGRNYAAAKTAATTQAIVELASQIEIHVCALLENSVVSQSLSAEKAEFLTETVMAIKNSLSQSIGSVIPVVERYRVVSNNNNEVVVHVAYNGEMAKQVAKKAIQKELEKKGEDLHNELEQVLGL